MTAFILTAIALAFGGFTHYLGYSKGYDEGFVEGRDKAKNLDTTN